MYMLFYFLMIRRPPRSTRTDTLFPYTTLFRSGVGLPLALVSAVRDILPVQPAFALTPWPLVTSAVYGLLIAFIFIMPPRSEEHTSELQSLMRISYAVFCLKTKKNTDDRRTSSTRQ